MSVAPAVIKKTQDSLGKFVKKPPLTEKLLSKPPFRFLHDVISAVIRETGALQGLYTDVESKSENVKGNYKMSNTFQSLEFFIFQIRKAKSSTWKKSLIVFPLH